jgi:tetratricopeptide (TPR) repeat protein
LSAGEFDSAFFYFNQVHEKNPTAISASNLGNLFYRKGLSFSMQGKIEQAIASYLKSIEFDSANVMSLNNLASLYSRNGNYSEALKYLLKGNKVEPENIMILENIAAVSFLNKDYEQAISFAGKALTINPSLKKSLGVMADTHRARGENSIAEKYQKILTGR